MNKFFIDIHKGLEKDLYPFDPVLFYWLIPFTLILLYLFT
jgi:hypothetical protein